MVVPGIGASDVWTGRLRRFLSSIGYSVDGWGLGRNDGDVPKLVPRLVERATSLAAEHDVPIRLIGWSLGGYLSREIARERPDLVERVITLGSPIVGGPSYTSFAARYERRGCNLEKIRADMLAREEQPIPVPIFSVYSRADAVVAWRACVDTFENPHVEHREITASHIGLIVAPRALGLIATLLERAVPDASGATSSTGSVLGSQPI